MTDPHVPDVTVPDPIVPDAVLADDALPSSVEAFEADLLAPVKKTRVRSIVFRAILIVGALAISGFILISTFEDLDYDAIVDSITSLEDADLIALVAMWMIWLASQGLLTASLVPGLPVRRGVIAYLGPAGVTAIIPGPSDLPFRLKMLTAWGYSPADATLAVAAGSVFSIGIKLVLPVVAAIGLLVSDAPIDGTLRTVVVIAVLVGLGILGIAFMLASEKRTATIGRIITPVYTFMLRLLRRPEPPDVAQTLIAARAESLERLRDRWMIGTWATVLTAATRFSLLLMAIRFTGTPDDAISWPQVFVVYAVVQGLTVLPITAGDAGVSEIAYIGLLTAAAGSQYVNQITAGVLIFRVLTWIVIIPIGLATLGVWQRMMARRPAEVPAATV
jgi:putative heme transporter